jgi:hypothetical protein
MSCAAERAGTGALLGAESEDPVPKISARRSWVVWPPVEGGGVGADSSPMRSTNESLSVRVDPTGFLSLTGTSAVDSFRLKPPSEDEDSSDPQQTRRDQRPTCAHDSRSDFWRRHPLQHASHNLPLCEQAPKFDRPLLNLQLEIRRKASEQDGDPVLLARARRRVDLCEPRGQLGDGGEDVLADEGVDVWRV